MRRASTARGEDGQASVELAGVLPLLALVGLVLWQAAIAGQALWLAGSAARSAARAQAIGGNPRSGAARVLPGALERGLRVERGTRGTVEVAVRVPAVVGRGTVGVVRARAAMEDQR